MPELHPIFKTSAQDLVNERLLDQEYCHISVSNGDETTFCGLRFPGGPSCSAYDGRVICADCGLPCCPLCAVQADLEQRLTGA